MSDNDILSTAVQAFNEQNYPLLATILIGFVFLWLFNELRKNYNETKLEDKTDIKKALKAYFNLHYAITAFQNDKIDSNKLFESFAQSVIFLPIRLTNIIMSLNIENLNQNSKELKRIKQEVENEFNYLKSKQYTITTFDPNQDVFVQGSWFFSKNNFDSFIISFIYAFFALTGIMYLLFFGGLTLNLSGLARINFIIILLNLVFSFMIFIYISDLIVKRSLRKGALLWFINLVALPWIIFTFILNLKYSLFNTISIIVFICLANKKKFLRPERYTKVTNEEELQH